MNSSSDRHRRVREHPSSLGRDGMTLLEVLVAVTILSVVLAAIYSTFFLSYRAVEGTEDATVKLQEARKAIDLMRCELEAAFFSGAEEGTLLKIEDRDFFGKQASTLSFTSFSALRPGLSKISYLVEPHDRRLTLLKRVESIYRDERTDAVDIMEGLEAFSVEVRYDDKWVKTWDTAVSAEIPEEVRVSMTVSMRGRTITLSDISRPRNGRAI